LISTCTPASLPNQAAENGLQLRSRFAQTLNVLRTVRLGLSLAAALLEDRFERPARTKNPVYHYLVFDELTQCSTASSLSPHSWLKT
jgi:hypothetical protein